MAPDEVTADLTVTRIRDRVFAVEFGDTGKKLDRYEAHASTVGGRSIVNVRDLSGTAGATPWDFAEYEFLRPDVIAIGIAGDAFEEVEKTPAALRARMAQPGAFTDFCFCVRLGKKE